MNGAPHSIIEQSQGHGVRYIYIYMIPDIGEHAL